MKAKELKEILSNIEDDEEIAIHIFGNNANAEHFLSLVNDKTFNRKIIQFVEKDKII